ncbi:hypothetical protein [Lentzea flava]|uniref:hypothetical protein n=1 Tax=Lentzea flava TaxID=103732 RepID=UPI0016707887|nr:hypothetical protein [Lentzea flava]MCP2204805.1 hypothetical protein [Lentzea flava]
MSDSETGESLGLLVAVLFLPPFQRGPDLTSPRVLVNVDLQRDSTVTSGVDGDFSLLPTIA